MLHPGPRIVNGCCTLVSPIVDTPGVLKRSQPVPHVVHYPDGVMKMKGFHLDGEMHGAWEWYRIDGSAMRTGEFDRGKQVGVWRTLERSGQLAKETDFSKRP